MIYPMDISNCNDLNESLLIRVTENIRSPCVPLNKTEILPIMPVILLKYYIHRKTAGLPLIFLKVTYMFLHARLRLFFRCKEGKKCGRETFLFTYVCLSKVWTKQGHPGEQIQK